MLETFVEYCRTTESNIQNDTQTTYLSRFKLGVLVDVVCDEEVKSVFVEASLVWYLLRNLGLFFVSCM